ncbi:MAG: sigma-70 family RNA polymerase sigma factor [Vicinamibacterales bacterium]
MTKHAAGEVTRLLDGLNAGDEQALPRILPLVYDELRRIAARRLHHEPAGHPLQATALVHEAYLRLAGQHEVRWKNRGHFFAVAAQAMRRVLVDHARARLADKRGGVQARVPLDDVVVASEPPPGDLVALDDALDRLARHDPHQARLVELRFFAGLTVEETADVLGISDTTVKREWRMARAWLHREMSRTAG